METPITSPADRQPRHPGNLPKVLRLDQALGLHSLEDIAQPSCALSAAIRSSVSGVEALVVPPDPAPVAVPVAGVPVVMVVAPPPSVNLPGQNREAVLGRRACRTPGGSRSCPWSQD